MTGTAAGRALLQAQLAELQEHPDALARLGTEVRLSGTGRRAPPSHGVPGQHQGSDLYRWSVWLFGFDDATVARRQHDEQWKRQLARKEAVSGGVLLDDEPNDDFYLHDDNDDDDNADNVDDDSNNNNNNNQKNRIDDSKKPSDDDGVADHPTTTASAAADAEEDQSFGAQLARYNEAAKAQCTMQYLRRVRYRRPQISLELRFADQHPQQPPMYRIIAPMLKPFATVDGSGIDAVGNVLGASADGDVFTQAPDGSLQRGDAASSGAEQRAAMSASVAFESRSLEAGWDPQCSVRDLLCELWLFLYSADAQVDMESSLEPNGGLPTVGGFWQLLHCQPPSVVDRAALECGGKVAESCRCPLLMFLCVCCRCYCRRPPSRS